MRPPLPDAHRREIEQTLLRRRELLCGLSGAALAGASSGTAAASVGEARQSAPDMPQYEETEHVRRFYALARR
jgi:hypothetical protein